MRTKRGGEAPSFRVCTWCGAGTWSFPADASTQSSRRVPKGNVGLTAIDRLLPCSWGRGFPLRQSDA